MLQYYSFRQVSGSALGSGCYSWQFRASSHSFTGSVLAARFLVQSFAASFAARWASRLGIFCAVRRFGAAWVVSVPCVQSVPVPQSAVPSCVARVFSVTGQFSHFGFSGSRSVVSPGCSVLAGLLRGRYFSGAVGCARGVDSFFSQAFPFLPVCSASAFGSGRSSFARRSIWVVESVARSSGLWCSFPASQCPSGLVPSGQSSRCFSGFGSGSWASLAYAAGLGCPCLVFLPAGVAFPVSWSLFSFQSLGGGWWFYPGA
jgi:hypothetical protein